MARETSTLPPKATSPGDRPSIMDLAGVGKKYARGKPVKLAEMKRAVEDEAAAQDAAVRSKTFHRNSARAGHGAGRCGVLPGRAVVTWGATARLQPAVATGYGAIGGTPWP